MKETAVEWFLKNLRNLIKESELTDVKPSEFDARERELLEQAKEMEKQQQVYSKEDIEKAFNSGLNRSFDSDFVRWFEQFKKK